MVGRADATDGLVGTVAIVAGGGRGIGRATALAFAEAGAAVVVAARSADEIEETASLVRAAASWRSSELLAVRTASTGI